jgi:YD repeat-containing protein
VNALLLRAQVPAISACLVLPTHYRNSIAGQCSGCLMGAVLDGHETETEAAVCDVRSWNQQDYRRKQQCLARTNFLLVGSQKLEVSEVIMVKKSLIVLLVCTLATTILCASVGAQSTGSCIGYGDGFAGPIYPGAFNCIYSTYILSWACSFFVHCPPPAAPIECIQCAQGKDSTHDPISLATGNTYIQQVDVKVPGLADGLSLVRTWNSQWPSTQMAYQVGLFGPNWRSTYEERVFVGSDNYVKYARSDGSFWSFGGAGSLYLVAPGNVVATLTVNSAYTQWILTFQNGEKRLFNYESGLLTAIVDRNGNTTQLTYDSTNRLVTATDPAGRQLYFGYGSDTSTLVTSVTSNVGISLSYLYDSLGRLIQVTKPDLTTNTFQYNSNSMITAVLDSNGVVLESHTYDSSGRGLTSSRANGVNAVTISYGTN